MLRSNRKNVLPSSNGTPSKSANGKTATNNKNGILPSYYTNGEPGSSGSLITNGSSPSIPFPTLQRRRRLRGSVHGVFRSQTSQRTLCCNKFTVIFVASCLLGAFLLLRDSDARPRVPTWADPPLMTWDHDPSALSPYSFFHRRRASASVIIPPHPPKEGTYDVAVLGAGPAGLTAALFAARAGLSVLVLGSDSGSLSETSRLDNFPSFMLENGPEWLQAAKRQAAQWGASFAQAGLLAQRLQLEQEQEGGTISTNFVLDIKGPKSMTASARSVIVATGATGRRLGIPLEDVLWGKSIHSCAVCDGSSYVDKTVVVVGGGDAAVDGALLLARYAKKVILVHRRNGFRASNQRNLDLLKNTQNIEIKSPYVVKQFETKPQEQAQIFAGVQLLHTETQEIQRVECDGVFELIGATPNTAWLKSSGVEMNSEGFLALSSTRGDTSRATTVEGIFAAGEVTDHTYRQAITASAEGAQAAMDAERWLRSHPSTFTAKHTNSKIPLQEIFATSPEHDTPLERKLDDPVNDDCDMWEEQCIKQIVNKFPVVMFSKGRCPECKKALETLTIEGLAEGHKNLHVIDITVKGTTKSKKTREMLLGMTGRKSVPNIFIGGTSIGGHDELVELHSNGKLRNLLVEAGAVDLENCDLVEEDCITSVVNKYPVVVFSKPWCPYCRRALEALSIEGLPEGHINLHVIDLSVLGKKAKVIQGTLGKMTGRRTVPNVFIGGSSIGGGDETVKFAREGKLNEMLTEAKALGGYTPEEAAEELEKEENQEAAAADNQKEVPGGRQDEGPCDLAQEPCLKKLLGTYPVVVFTKHGCPHCTRALEALALEGLVQGDPRIHVVNLSAMEQMSRIQDTLEVMTGRRTVPNVFLGSSSIGGGSETAQLQQNGELRTMLEKVGAIEAPKARVEEQESQKQQEGAEVLAQQQQQQGQEEDAQDQVQQLQQDQVGAREQSQPQQQQQQQQHEAAREQT